MKIPAFLRLRSLTLNIFIVLAIGLLLIQLLSFGLVTALLESQTRQKMFAFMQADIALVHGLLNDLPAGERETRIRDVNRGFYVLSLRAGPVMNPVASRETFASLYKVSDRIAVMTGLPAPDWVWIGGEEDSRPALVLPFRDGQMLQVDARDPLPSLSGEALAVYLFGIFIGVAFFAWLALRLVMQPLALFVQTAQRLGRDLNTPLAVDKQLREVRNVVVVLDQMRQRILAEFKRHTQMLAAISHDMQTPITRTLLRAELIEDRALRRKITGELHFMSDLIAESVEYGRTSALRFKPAPLDLDALVTMIANEEVDMGHDVVVRGAIGVPVWGSLNDLRRAIQNIVDNAIKYAGKAEIELLRNGPHARIYVRDNGPGIDASLMGTIHKPFFRVETSRSRKSGGTGLGLSISYNIIAAHHGEITLHNRPDGMEVQIKLPLEPPEKTAEGGDNEAKNNAAK